MLGKNTTEEKTNLCDNYEELRAYAISPVKIPSQPLGLDLWLKKGFLSWIAIMRHRYSPSIPLRYNPEQSENLDIPIDLVISLSNILTEWSNKNVGKQNQERAFDT